MSFALKELQIVDNSRRSRQYRGWQSLFCDAFDVRKVVFPPKLPTRKIEMTSCDELNTNKDKLNLNRFLETFLITSLAFFSMISLSKLVKEWQKAPLFTWNANLPSESNPTFTLSHGSDPTNANSCPISVLINDNLCPVVKVQHFLVSTLPGGLPKQITSISILKECLSIVKSWRLCPGITTHKFAMFSDETLPKTKDHKQAAKIENNPRTIRSLR